MPMYNLTDRQYRAVLSEDIHRTVWFRSPVWGPLTGFLGVEAGNYQPASISGMNDKTKLQPTGKVVEVRMDFETQSSITMDIPVLYPLTEQPRYGDAQLLQNEEQRKVLYKSTAVNQVRHGVVTQSTQMDFQALPRATRQALMKKAASELNDYLSRWKDYNYYLALLMGYSQNLFATKENKGLNITPYSHPNFFVANAAAISGTPFTDAYEANIISAINGLTDQASCYFSTAAIDAMCFYASQRRIPKYDVGGGEKAWIIAISTAQKNQLLNDSKWVAAQQSLKSINPTLTGIVEGRYREAYIIVDPTIPGIIPSNAGHTNVNPLVSTGSTRNLIQYGNANYMANPINTVTNYSVAILMGSSSIVAGNAKKITVREETFDYGEKQAEGASMIVGATRSDVIDNDGYFGTPDTFLENTSSLALVTLSPNTVKWS